MVSAPLAGPTDSIARVGRRRLAGPEYTRTEEIDMDTAFAHDAGLHARDQLLQRRERLESVIAEAPDARALARLLEEVDAALGRLDRGTFGVCDVCDGTRSEERRVG